MALSVAAIAVSGVQAGGHSKARNKQYFDIDGGKVAQPYNFNNLVPGTTRSNDHQAVFEPLFILNYETGDSPWMGGFTSNSSLDVWTLLRKGIKWSDGEI